MQLTREEVLAIVYDPTYRRPDGFFIDERASTVGSYTIHHVMDQSISFEVCTDDVSEAASWEADDNASRAVQGELVGIHENNRYFEFVRELSYDSGVGNIEDPTTPGFARIFKCSYVNRDGVDRNVRVGYAGTLNVRPITPDELRTFTEYLWQFTFFWPSQPTVLLSVASEDVDALAHTLRIALRTKQGADRCDLIEVVDWVFRVDERDGHLTKRFLIRDSFEAEVSDGMPKVCRG